MRDKNLQDQHPVKLQPFLLDCSIELSLIKTIISLSLTMARQLDFSMCD